MAISTSYQLSAEGLWETQTQSWAHLHPVEEWPVWGLGGCAQLSLGSHLAHTVQLVVSSFPNPEASQVPFSTSSHVQSHWACPSSPPSGCTWPPGKVGAILVTDLQNWQQARPIGTATPKPCWKTERKEISKMLCFCIKIQESLESCDRMGFLTFKTQLIAFRKIYKSSFPNKKTTLKAGENH